MTHTFTGVDVTYVLVGNSDAPVIGEDVVCHFLSHLHHECFVDDIAVHEEVGVNFIDSGENDAAAVVAVEDGGGDSVHEHADVDALAQPAAGLDEHVKVLGKVQELEYTDSLLNVFLVSVDKYLPTRKHTHLEHLDEILHNLGFLQV